MSAKNIKTVKEAARKAGKFLTYNRSLGGYQITSGFCSSEVVYPARYGKSRKIYLGEYETEMLLSMARN